MRPHNRDRNGAAPGKAGVRRVRENGRAVGASAHLPAVWRHLVLRQLAQPPRDEARARERASGGRLGGARGAVAVLLSRRSVRRVLKRPPMALLTPPVGPRDHALGPADAPVTRAAYGDT